LDGKKKAWNKPSKEKTEKLVKCRACHHVFMGKNTCPLCGTPVVSFGKKIQTIEAELEEIGDKVNKSMGEKRMWFGMFKAYRQLKGYNEGWQAHKYRERFGVWPKGMDDVAAVTPNDEFRNWIRHLNIKFAKSQEKYARQNELRQSA
jgi:RNA polymerase subunit RPABC4/transcription elongation factor Spt4